MDRCFCDLSRRTDHPDLHVHRQAKEYCLWDLCHGNDLGSLMVWDISSGLQIRTVLLFWTPRAINPVSYPLLLQAGLDPRDRIQEGRQTHITQAPWKYRKMITWLAPNCTSANKCLISNPVTCPIITALWGMASWKPHPTRGHPIQACPSERQPGYFHGFPPAEEVECC